MKFFGGLGQMLTRLPRVSQCSASFDVVISRAHVFPLHGICPGPHLRVQGHPPPLTVLVYLSEFVSVSVLLQCACRLTSSVHFLAVFFVSNVLSGPFCLEIARTDNVQKLSHTPA